MRRAALLAAVGALLAPTVLAQSDEPEAPFYLESPGTINGRPGITFGVTVQGAHVCPASRSIPVEFDVRGPAFADITVVNASWGPCRATEPPKAFVSNTLAIDLPVDAPSGPFQLDITARWNGEVARTTATVNVLWFGVPTLEGPREVWTPVNRSAVLRFNVSLHTNGPAKLTLSDELPRGWSADYGSTQHVSYRAGRTQVVVPWTVTVMAPPGAKDIRPKFEVRADYDGSPPQKGLTSSFQPLLRIPSAGPSLPTTGADAPILVQERQKDGPLLPVWAYGLLFFLLGAATLWKVRG